MHEQVYKPATPQNGRAEVMFLRFYRHGVLVKETVLRVAEQDLRRQELKSNPRMRRAEKHTAVQVRIEAMSSRDPHVCDGLLHCLCLLRGCQAHKHCGQRAAITAWLPAACIVMSQQCGMTTCDGLLLGPLDGVCRIMLRRPGRVSPFTRGLGATDAALSWMITDPCDRGVLQSSC